MELRGSIGNTPLVRLHTIKELKCELVAKCEFMNPGGSLKDRVARRFLKELEEKREVCSGTSLIVPTSGHLGLSIAMLSASKGYKTIATIPEKTSADLISQLKSMGVEIWRTSNKAHQESVESNIGLARKLAGEIPNSFLVDELSNPLGVLAHREETAEEILKQTDGKLDILVVSVESGSLITGLGKRLKEKLPNLKIIGVIPNGSVYAPGCERNPDISQSKMEGIGAQYNPSVLDRTVVDRWVVVRDEEVFPLARRLIAEEGLFVGSSSGAVLKGAILEAASLAEDQRCLLVFNDSARSYTSTLLNEEWMSQHGLLGEALLNQKRVGEDKYRGAAVAELNLPTPKTISPSSSLAEALETMVAEDFDFLPVVSQKKFIGFLSSSDLKSHLHGKTAQGSDPVDSLMHRFEKRKRQYELITPETPLFELEGFFDRHPVGFVTDSERIWCLGVVTRHDLRSYLLHRGKRV